MQLRKFQPSADLAPLVNYYWTLEVPAMSQPIRQRIVPDGCIEMAFILGDDIKRYTSEVAFVIQPRELVIGQISKPYFIEPTGYVNTFAVSFFPFGFGNFVTRPIHELADKETPIEGLFGPKVASELSTQIIAAENAQLRIQVIEAFLSERLSEQLTIDAIVQSTVDALIATKGNTSIGQLLRAAPARRRQLERKFKDQIGISPKQLARIIRLQAALKLLLTQQEASLTHIAYQSDYYDQAHFIRDFKAFTGVSPKAFLGNDTMALSTLFYQ